MSLCKIPLLTHRCGGAETAVRWKWHFGRRKSAAVFLPVCIWYKASLVMYLKTSIKSMDLANKIKGQFQDEYPSVLSSALTVSFLWGEWAGVGFFPPLLVSCLFKDIYLTV